MSSLATAPSGTPPRARTAAAAGSRAVRRSLRGDRALGLALGVILALIAFVTTGGVDLGPNTWTEIAIVFAGTALGAAALLLSAPGRLWGGTALLLFAALAALTLLSISWSVQPSDSWVEANRSISYLAAFGGAIALSRLIPLRWPAMVGAIGVASTIVCGYALLVKVFPATLEPTEVLGRLRAPFDYWNAVGLMAALGLPALLWAGTRREGRGPLRAVAVPAIAVLVIVLMLSYSRGALLVAILGLALWFVIVPLRLRGALVLSLGALGGAAGSAWALATDALTRDQVSLSSRTTAGHAFGLVLVLLLLVLTVAGFAAAFAMDRVELEKSTRRRVAIVLLALLACVPLAGIAAMAASSRGLTGEVSHIWSTLTNTKGGAGDNASRLVQVSNSRARYWSEGVKVGEHSLWTGVGAVGYGIARLRYTSDKLLAQHAHSYVIETFADFGLIGLALSAALLAAWSVAAARAVGLRNRLRSGDSALTEDQAAERIGLLTLLVVVVTFGLHSAIDWTWFVPGVALPALICAGWLAGRGPLAHPTGLAVPRPSLVSERGAAAALLAAVALVCAWTIWQPLRSANAADASVAALAKGNAKAALADARSAAARNPVDVEPLWDLSAIYGAIGRPGAAHAELTRAVRLQPANPATWLQLGEYDLQLGRRQEAIAVLQAALYLNPYSPEAQSAAAQASAPVPVPSVPARARRHAR
ncbi:MAG TPA: O-antigen ligase family protein [Solirubrobacteraceae bacterium]|nr:O-antigen ligase family protein [Solirubrobacteraceae bacterium]